MVGDLMSMYEFPFLCALIRDFALVTVAFLRKAEFCWRHS